MRTADEIGKGMKTRLADARFNQTWVWKAMHADDEFRADTIAAFFRTHDLKQTLVPPFVSQLKGRSERLMRTLKEPRHILFSDASLPSAMWSFAMIHVTHIRTMWAIVR